ncbi:unnamed protein product [Linum trigynum]|uniref:Uncharacterized protein n=1 Tax=Linum trigynum TaxID=586398 RepID=A0AAV2EP93_9ROSI
MMSPRSSTRVSPFSLTYGHEAFLLVEVTVNSLRYMKQHELTPREYHESMMLELCDLDELQLRALDNVQVQKARVARAYNKKVRHKSFEEGERVWKAHLPIEEKDPKFGNGRQIGVDHCGAFCAS